MVAMLVRDDDRIETGNVFADGGQALADFAAADARVDQNTRCLGGNENAVAGAAARKDTDFNDGETPWRGSVRGSGVLLTVITKKTFEERIVLRGGYLKSEVP
jgi:hypothetical protein